jgi:hypothetical protein
MNEYEFNEAIMPLENMFDKIRPEVKKEHFRIFQNYPLYTFKDAVRWLIKNHGYKRFPLPAEIEDAVKEIDRVRSYATAEDLDILGPKCESCGGTGWKLIEKEEPIYLNEKERGLKHDVATFCDCKKGASMKRTHIKGESKNRPRYQNIIPPGEGA